MWRKRRIGILQQRPHSLRRGVQPEDLGKAAIAYGAARLGRERRLAVHDIGHGLHSLVPHTCIGRLEGPQPILHGKTSAHGADGAGKAREARAAGYGSAQIRQLEMTVRIDKSGAQRSGIELRRGVAVELLPLPHRDDKARIVYRDHGTRYNLPSVEEQV